jgi:hypothetical protein
LFTADVKTEDESEEAESGGLVHILKGRGWSRSCFHSLFADCNRNVPGGVGRGSRTCCPPHTSKFSNGNKNSLLRQAPYRSLRCLLPHLLLPAAGGSVEIPRIAPVSRGRIYAQRVARYSYWLAVTYWKSDASSTAPAQVTHPRPCGWLRKKYRL